MKTFHYYEPSALEEALDILHQYGARAKVLAGGTDLVVQMKQGKIKPEAIINLTKLQELNFMAIDSAVRIGPLTPLSRIAANPFFSGRLALISEAALAVGDVQIRNSATLGGNIANASPSADMPPALLALGAQVRLRKKGGARVVSLEELCLGPFSTSMEKDEIIVEISISPIPEGSGAYVWMPKRTAVDETLVGVGTWLQGDAQGETCSQAVLALNSVAPVPFRAREAEAFLQGKNLSRENFRIAGEIAAEEASPRSRADYRKTLVSVLMEEALERALRRAQ
ncbi:MAG: xanthine dehydrogenase family protein subunit M [Deltaproteobacteria bacterium]|nr:xanthine dehydrogenase family protein subunit M [Deltaproteobacteria bacterium]